MKAIRRILVLAALAAACSSSLALGQTAFFTGRQESVMTVTYQLAWRCEYNYLGTVFWRVFKNGCPSSVEVE